MVPALRGWSGKRSCVRSWGVRMACLLLVTVTLAACDKCGNTVFRTDAGPSVCKDERPK
jgi:hypothetical protein